MLGEFGAEDTTRRLGLRQEVEAAGAAVDVERQPIDRASERDRAPGQEVLGRSLDFRRHDDRCPKGLFWRPEVGSSGNRMVGNGIITHSFATHSPAPSFGSIDDLLFTLTPEGPQHSHERRAKTLLAPISPPANSGFEVLLSEPPRNLGTNLVSLGITSILRDQARSRISR